MRYFKKSDANWDLIKLLTTAELNFTRVCENFIDSASPWNGSKWSTAYIYHLGRRLEYPWVYSELKQLEDINLVRGQNRKKIELADIGVGISFFPTIFSVGDFNYHAIDELDFSNFWNNFQNVDFIQQDITGEVKSEFLAFFDVVISISVLEHIEEEKKFASIENAVKMLKPGGSFIFTADVTLENSTSGFTFQGLYKLVAFLERLGLASEEEIDLTLYDDIMTTESLIGLPEGRYRLPWRLEPPRTSRLRNLFGRNETGVEPSRSVAVVRGHFKLKN